MVPVFKNVRERSTTKNYRPLSLSVVSKIFEKLVNNRIDSPREMWPFFLFSVWF